MTLAKQFHLNQDEKEELLPSGRQGLFYNRVAWARFHLVKAGMAETKIRSTYVATDARRKLLLESLERITVAILRQHNPNYFNNANEHETEIGPQNE